MLNADASLYHDFSGLAELRYQAREDQAGATAKVARQFESLFVQMMVKQMRQASFGGGIFDSDRTRFYQDMYDQQLAVHLSQQGGIGLSEVMTRQLGGETDQAQVTLGGLEPYWRSPVASALRASVAAIPDATESQSVEENAPEITNLDTPERFVQELWASAEAAADELGLPAEALLAQAALETGWGKHVMSGGDSGSSHNLFGIKADQRWQGSSVRQETLEYESGLAVRRRERFRSYESFEQSFQDYVAFVKGSPRYAEAISETQDPQAYFQALQDAGYATDPAYADKILRVMQGPEMRSALASLKTST
jgi:flagellar protein FlgJ